MSKLSTKTTWAAGVRSPVFLEGETEQLSVRVERSRGSRRVHLKLLRDGVLPEVVRVRLGEAEVDLDVGHLAGAAVFPFLRGIANLYVQGSDQRSR